MSWCVTCCDQACPAGCHEFQRAHTCHPRSLALTQQRTHTAGSQPCTFARTHSAACGGCAGSPSAATLQYPDSHWQSARQNAPRRVVPGITHCGSSGGGRRSSGGAGARCPQQVDSHVSASLPIKQVAPRGRGTAPAAANASLALITFRRRRRAQNIFRARQPNCDGGGGGGGGGGGDAASTKKRLRGGAKRE